MSSATQRNIPYISGSQMPLSVPEILPRDPQIRDLTWQELANCADAEPDIFYPEQNHSPSEALQYCANCIVKETCLIDTIKNDYRDGVRGGLTEKQRAPLHRQYEKFGRFSKKIIDIHFKSESPLL